MTLYRSSSRCQGTLELGMDSSIVSGGHRMVPHHIEGESSRSAWPICLGTVWSPWTAEWPPRSPDLTPLDFFFWGHLKSKVFATPPANLHELQQRIVTEVDTLRQDRALIRRAVNGMMRRATLCVERRGGHVENWVWTYQQKDFLKIELKLWKSFYLPQMHFQMNLFFYAFNVHFQMNLFFYAFNVNICTCTIYLSEITKRTLCCMKESWKGELNTSYDSIIKVSCRFWTHSVREHSVRKSIFTRSTKVAHAQSCMKYSYHWWYNLIDPKH